MSYIIKYSEKLDILNIKGKENEDIIFEALFSMADVRTIERYKKVISIHFTNQSLVIKLTVLDEKDNITEIYNHLLNALVQYKKGINIEFPKMPTMLS